MLRVFSLNLTVDLVVHSTQYTPLVTIQYNSSFPALMAAEESLKHTMSSSSPASPHSEVDSLEESENPPQTKQETPALEAAKFHCGLINLKQIQERSFSLVNQALLRQKMVEEQIKIERDTSEKENNNDNTSVNNNKSEESTDSLSFEEARRRFLSESSGQGGGRLAFSVENILAPGKFGREMDGDGEQYGRIIFKVSV